MRTKGFCWALLRCGEIKLIAEKRVQIDGGTIDQCNHGGIRILIPSDTSDTVS